MITTVYPSLTSSDLLRRTREGPERKGATAQKQQMATVVAVGFKKESGDLF